MILFLITFFRKMAFAPDPSPMNSLLIHAPGAPCDCVLVMNPWILEDMNSRPEEKEVFNTVIPDAYVSFLSFSYLFIVIYFLKKYSLVLLFFTKILFEDSSIILTKIFQHCFIQGKRRSSDEPWLCSDDDLQRNGRGHQRKRTCFRTVGRRRWRKFNSGDLGCSKSLHRPHVHDQREAHFQCWKHHSQG